MSKGGTIVATALVLSLIATAAPALAVEVPHEVPSVPVPTVPNLPPPPASVGRCFQWAQGHLNGVTAEASAARDIGFLLFQHESGEATLLFAEVSQSLTPQEDDIVGTFQGIGGASNAAFGLVAEVPLALGEGAGDALAKIVGGSGIVAVALVPIVPDQAAVLVPYAGEAFQAAFDPIMAFNRDTSLGTFTGEPTYVLTWGIDYVLLLSSGHSLPLMPTNEGAEEASGGASLALEGVADLAWTASDASDASFLTLLDIIDVGGPLAEGAGDQAQEGRGATEQRAGSMTSLALDDLELLRIHLEGAHERLAARSEGFPGDGPDCPGGL